MGKLEHKTMEKARQLTGLVPLLLLALIGGCAKASPSPSGGCDCTANVYDCRDFRTQREAQACFESCQNRGNGDVHWLDGDDDTVACEWNRY